MVDISSEGRAGQWRLKAIMALIGLMLGLAVGWASGHLIGGAGLHHRTWSDFAALAIAIAYLGAGLMTAVFSLDRRSLAVLADAKAPDFNRPIAPDQKLYLRLQAAVMTLAGALLAAPIVLAPPISAPSPADGLIGMGVVVGLFTLQSVLNLSLWNRSDEVFRQSIAQTGAVCFWLLQGALFLWASGEKFRLLPAISSWDAVTVMMGVYLAASTLVAHRRGLV